MAVERLWLTISPVSFTVNGGADGTVTIQDTCGFKVKQVVVISALSLPDLVLEVKRVVSPTKLIVGPKVTTGKMIARQDLSTYTIALLANIRAEEQPKVRVPPPDVVQAVYEQEPTVALRTIGVDCIGDPWSANNPMPVKGDLNTTVEISNDSPAKFKIQNITTPPIADTEFPILFPDDTKRFEIRVRDDVARGRIAELVGETASKYWGLTRGTVFNSDSVDLGDMTSIYMSVNKPSVVVEVISFTL